MTAATHRPAPTGAPRAPDHVATRGPIVVATDGTRAADAALRVGALIAVRDGAPMYAVSVVDDLLVPTDDGTQLDPLHADPSRKAERLHAIRAQVGHAIGARAACDVEVHVGSPTRSIARVAAGCGARLLVVGLGRHRLRDRVPGRETALQLTRIADVPVLAVPPDAADLPARAVIATDFSDCSVRAARAALPLLDRGAIVFIAHAVPRSGSIVPGWETASRSLDVALADAFARFRAALPITADLAVKDVVLHGAAGDAVLEFVADTGADLVVAGSHGHGFLERLVLGSVSSQLVREARCAVLVAPPIRTP